MITPFIIAIIMWLLTPLYSYAYFERGLQHEEEPQSQMSQEESKKVYYLKLFKDSLDFFTPDTPPIIREYLKNPDDPFLTMLVIKYFEEGTKRAQIARENVLKFTRIGQRSAVYSTNTEDELITKLKNLRNYKVLYFYSKTCPHCQASEPVIQLINNYLPVEKYEVQETPSMFFFWRVDSVPVTFFQKDNNAYRFNGELSKEGLLEFLKKIPE
jgi:hypothetical protein